MTMELPSTKPYLIRAIHEWCSDNGFTPYIAVVADERARVPREFVRDGQIVLNIAHEATGHLSITNDGITFQARFAGVARDISVPIANVVAIYAKENGAGMAFEPESESLAAKAKDPSTAADQDSKPEPPPAPPAGRPKLQRVK
jgi:stringent starvation protein B